ncbi:hypothetical protein [Oricola sp.]|uniref:hypothetical protein n=1 Tax=Oricola sp. TaxID=1979950 RepID=UPI0025ECDCB7|nr:hypothetical protein [Oricola sp.]MCI5075664.1 hypothetical protein [Oricola sp.]
MSTELGITKLPHGYLVDDGRGDNLAALSNFSHLVDWLADAFDEAACRRGAPKGRALEVSDRIQEMIDGPMGRLQARLEGLDDVGNALAALLADAASAETAVETEEDPPFEEDPMAQFLAGPEQIVSEETERKVRETLSEIPVAKDEAPQPETSVEPAPEPAPSAAASPADTVETLTDNQTRVLDALQLRQLQAGPGRFKVTIKQIAQASGVASTTVPAVTRALASKGLITIHSTGQPAAPVYYEAPMTDEGDGDEA